MFLVRLFEMRSDDSVSGVGVLRKHTRRRACALERAWRCFRYEYIYHNLRTEHECILLRSPRIMASTVIFP
jgi:hypothetical protein